MIVIEVMIDFSASSNDEQLDDLQLSLGAFLRNNGIEPHALTCRHGSTQIIVQFLVDSVKELIGPSIGVLGGALRSG